MKYLGSTTADRDLITLDWLNANKQNKLAYQAMSSATIDLSSGDVFSYTVTGDTTFTVSNPNNYSLFTLLLTNGGAGEITYPSCVKWTDNTPPALQEEGLDMLMFITMDGGETWLGLPGGLNLQGEEPL